MGLQWLLVERKSRYLDLADALARADLACQPACTGACMYDELLDARRTRWGTRAPCAPQMGRSLVCLCSALVGWYLSGAVAPVPGRVATGALEHRHLGNGCPAV